MSLHHLYLIYSESQIFVLTYEASMFRVSLSKLCWIAAHCHLGQLVKF